MRPTRPAMGLLLSFACGRSEPVAVALPEPEPDARAIALAEVLERADAAYSDRQAVAEKYAKMASDPYAFFRGTLPWFVRQAPTGWRSDAEVPLIGDPHPENLGTMQTGTGLVLAWVDLDAATVGDPSHDVRRLALGAALLVHPLPDCACVSDMVSSVHQGYHAALEGRSEAPAPLLADLLEEASEEGASHRRFGALWEGASMRRDAEHTDVDVDLARSVLAQAHPDAVVLDAVQRLGKGIASRPARRLLVAVAPEQLLDVRELARPPMEVGPRLVDPVWYRETEVDGVAWRVRDQSSYAQSVTVEDVHGAWLSADLSRADLLWLGRTLGQVLGEAHRRGGLTRVPGSAEDLRSVIATDLLAVHEDHARFRDLLSVGRLPARDAD